MPQFINDWVSSIKIKLNNRDVGSIVIMGEVMPIHLSKIKGTFGTRSAYVCAYALLDHLEKFYVSV